MSRTRLRPRSQRGLALLLALGVLASLAVTAFSEAPAPAADNKEVVFTVGTKQDVDNMNPYAGVVLSAYEVWNMEYNVLVNLGNDKNMGPIPELATSWERSPDGLTWTFHLRDDVKWSDGKPLTSADVVYTFTRTRDEQWSNFWPFTKDFTKVTAPDATTVVVQTKQPDPRLPSLPVYILPKHVWEKYGPKKVSGFSNNDPVTSGPFRLTAWNKGSYFEMTANKNYFGGKPAVDKVRFRIFRNDEAMAAALKNGEIDAIYNLSPDLAGQLKGDSNITPINAQDGSFTQLTMNTGSGKIGNGHPALEDVRVRQAIAHAIDKDTLVKRVVNGLATKGQSMSVAVAPKWNIVVPDDKEMKFNIAEANKILDDAGYKKGSDGIRTMPDGSKKLNFRFYFPSDDETYSRDVQFIKEWLQEIGISSTPTPKSEDELTPIENKGQFDLIIWTWTPYADRTAMMSYLTCAQVPKKPDDGLYNDAFYCDPEYDRLFDAQQIELNEAKRIDLVHQALQRFYDQAPYVVLYDQDTVEGYRNDRYTGFVRQPAETGPIIYTQSDPSYSLIKPISSTTGSSGSGSQAASSSDSGSSSSTGLIIAIIAGVVIVVGGGIFIARRRQTADEREQRGAHVNTRYVLKRVGAAFLSLVFVLALNFVLFRMVKSDPVGSLFRGRNVSQTAKERLRAQFGLDKSMPEQFVAYIEQTAQGNLGISYSTRQPVADEIAGKIWPTVLLVGSATILSAIIGVFAGIRGAWKRNSAFDRGSTGVSMITYAIPDFYLGILLLAFFAFWLAWLPTGGMETAGGGGITDTMKHLALPCAALAISYFGEYTIIMRSSLLEVLGEDYLITARAKGLRDILVRRRHAVPNAILPVITLFALNLGFVLSGAIAVETVFSWPGLGQATEDALKGPDYPMLQGLFLLFSAAIILTNLITDLIYGYLDPRVSTP